MTVLVFDSRRTRHAWLRTAAIPRFPLPAQTVGVHAQRVRSEAEQLSCGGPIMVGHECIKKDGQPLCQEYRDVCFDQEHVISYDG